MPDIDPGTIAILAASLAFAGVLGGLLAGLLGVGGGIVIVPVLFHVFTALDIAPESRMHLAVGTSLSTIIVTSVVSARAHRRRGSVDAGLLRRWAAFIVIGVILGSWIAGRVETETLMLVFATLGLLVAIHMAFLKGAAIASDLPRRPIQAVMAVLVGGFSTLMGIGGGTLTVPLLSLCRFPMRLAVGTAAAIGLIIAVPGTIGFIVAGWGATDTPPLSLGYVNLLGFALLVPLTSLCAPIGARIAHRIDERWLRRAFALFLAITAVRMLADALAA
jgi:uncharacterized membrane protein YfcA